MLRIVTTGLLAIGVLGGTLMPAAAEQAADPCSSAKTIEIQPIGGWQVMTGAAEEDGAPEDGALVLARASRNTVFMMACHAGKARYALFDPAMRLPSGQPVELDIRIDQHPVVRVTGKPTGKDGQIDLRSRRGAHRHAIEHHGPSDSHCDPAARRKSTRSPWRRNPRPFSPGAACAGSSAKTLAGRHRAG